MVKAGDSIVVCIVQSVQDVIPIFQTTIVYMLGCCASVFEECYNVKSRHDSDTSGSHMLRLSHLVFFGPRTQEQASFVSTH
jgi:hypothetical protein